ncbi:MAG: T9SS type A sorting domain-containing protein [Fidelibacterota bacterium]
MKYNVNRSFISIGVLLILLVCQLSADPSTFAMRMNGHKHNMEEDFLDRAVQEWYDAFKDSLDLTTMMDSILLDAGLEITDFSQPEDATVFYLEDAVGEFDFIIGLSLDNWVVVAEGGGCIFDIGISGIGAQIGGSSQFGSSGLDITMGEPTPLEPTVTVNGSGALWCSGMESTVQAGIELVLDSFMDSIAVAMDSIGFDSLFVFGDLISSLGIDDEELLAEAFSSFPMDIAIVTENDPEQDVVQLIYDINFLTGTTADPQAFVGIEPDPVTGSHLEIGGFSYLYWQLQRGFHWHEDWDEVQRVDAAFNLMDSLSINGFRMETFWSRVQTQAYMGENLNPADVTPEMIEDFLADPVYWNDMEFSAIFDILDESVARGLTPFMAIGVGHQDRPPKTAEGLTIAPASPEWSLPENYVAVPPETYLYNLKIYAHATVRKYASYVDVWQAENELNAAAFAAASPDWWRKGDFWLDRDFRNQVMDILVEAIHTEDPTALITHDLHMLGFMEALEDWVDDLDIIGFNYYPNQAWALPNMGFSVGEYVWAVRRALAGLGYAGKPVWLIESGFPGIELNDPPDTLSLAEDMIYFSENRQDQYITEALSSAVDNGINGFFYFSLTAEEDEDVGGGGALNTFMRFSGLIRKDTDEPKVALAPYAQLYDDLVVEVSINPSIKVFPGSFVLYQNYPNPFNPLTSIRFVAPGAGYVNLVIYDILGREVETLVSGQLESVVPVGKQGEYEVTWDATKYPSGVYFYQLQVGDFSQTRKLLLMK